MDENKMKNLEAMKEFFERDMKIKETLMSLAPTEADDYDELSRMEYVDKLEEIHNLISKDAVYSGMFDQYTEENILKSSNQTKQVDELFLSQINSWRIALSNELYAKGGRYSSLEVLNDVVQEFINQIYINKSFSKNFLNNINNTQVIITCAEKIEFLKENNTYQTTFYDIGDGIGVTKKRTDDC